MTSDDRAPNASSTQSAPESPGDADLPAPAETSSSPLAASAPAPTNAAASRLLDALDDEPRLDDVMEQSDVELRAEGVALLPERASWLAALLRGLPIAYAGIVVLRDGRVAPWARVSLAIAALVLARWPGRAIDDLPAKPRRSARIALIATVSAGLLYAGRAQGPLAALAPLLASIAAAGAVLATESLPGLGGLGALCSRERRVWPMALAVGWPVVGAIETARSLIASGLSTPALSPELLAFASWLEAAVAGLALLDAALSFRARRRELGARERHEVRWLVASLVAFGWCAMALPHADILGAQNFVAFVAPIVALCIATGSVAALTISDPIAAATQLLRTWAAIVGATTAWMLLWIMHAHVSLGFSLAVGAAVGLGASTLAATLGLGAADVPRVRRALSRARSAIAAADSLDLARGVLGAVRVLAGRADPIVAAAEGPLRTATPHLCTFAPAREVRLGAAGEPLLEARSASALMPSILIDLLRSEPLGVVRAELLGELEVRRPDLRAALRWCEARHAAAVVALVHDGDLEGALVVPSGSAMRSIGLRQARALRQIARDLAARIALDDALLRAAERAERADTRAAEANAESERARARADAQLAALQSTATPFREIADALYAPASRLLAAAIDRAAESQAPLLLAHRPGTDPLPWAARLHRRAQARGAFHVIDAAAGPLDLGAAIESAHDGTLVVSSAHLLSAAQLATLLLAHEARLVLASATRSPLTTLPSELLAPDVTPHSFDGVDVMRIPPLADRLEDLRSMCLAFLARASTSRAGGPVGLGDDALATLLEHDWQGDDAELLGVLARALSVLGDDGSVRLGRAHVLSALAPENRESPSPALRPKSARTAPAA